MAYDEGLAQSIVQLLAQPQYQGHPLHSALTELLTAYQVQQHQLEKITRISDGYQRLELEHKQSLYERQRRQQRQLEKITRISDRYQTMLRELNQTLRELSTRDSLTGLYNRRFMLDRLHSELQTPKRRASFSLMLADIDFFKRINDGYGHDAGDQVLVTVANCIHDSLREADVCARWGGEEFLILLPETRLLDALTLGEQVRLAVAALEIDVQGALLRPAISIGLVEHHPGEPLRNSLRRADSALYRAKRKGRNRCCLG